MKKRGLALLLITALTCTSLIGCGKNTQESGKSEGAGGQTAEEGAKTSEGLAEKVEAAINQYIELLIHANMDLTYIPYSQWEDQMNMVVASGEQVDLMCTVREISGYYKNGALTPLTGLLDTVFLNEDYMSRLFRKQEGISLTQYMTDRKSREQNI